MAVKDRSRSFRIAALAGWLVSVVIIQGSVLFLATTDPHGVSVSPAIQEGNIARVEPLYGAAWTGDEAVAWSPDGNHLAVVGSGVTILDAATGRVSNSWGMRGLISEAVAWSPDGSDIAVTSLDGFYGPIRLTVFSENGIARASWIAHDDYDSQGLAFSPDGTRLLSASGGHAGEFAIWETGTWRELLRRGNVTTGSSASWSPDGTRFALGGSAVTVVDAVTGATLWDDAGGVTYAWGRAAWSPRGDLIAVGTDESRLRLYRPDGTLVADTAVPTSDFFGTQMSWSPDGTLLATAAHDGIRILSVNPVTVVRLLAFPTGLFYGGHPLEDNMTLDRAVAWSPRGNAIASTATMSHPSLRVWGIRSSPMTVPLLSLGVAWILGLALVLGDDLRFALRHPGEVARTWQGADSSLSIGRALFGIAIVLSVVTGLTGDVLTRIHSVQPMPSLSWYGFTALLSFAIAIPPAVTAAFAYHRAAWDPKRIRPYPELAPRVFGVVLLPFLLALGALPIIQAAVLGGSVPLIAADSTYEVPIAAGAILGLGAVYSARVGRGFPGVSRLRAWWGLIASLLVSIGVFFLMFFLLFVALTLAQVQLLGDLQRYGLTVVFAFGLLPLAVVLAAIAVAAVGGLIPALVKVAWPGYARLHGNRVMSLDARKVVMSYVERQPGIHFRDLIRLSHLGSGTVHYHLYVLEREGFIICRREGVMKRFYPVPHRQGTVAAPA